MNPYKSTYLSPLGEMVMTAEDGFLTGLWFVGQKHYDAPLLDACEERDLPIFVETHRWLDTYFAGERPSTRPALRLKGTPFRRDVWNILLSIPYGHTMTYKDIATLIAEGRGMASMSAQAVGGAVGHNPVSIIVPCHRVLGTDGTLTGYAGGTERKARLLALEGICLP